MTLEFIIELYCNLVFKARMEVDDLFTDLADGKKLLKLLEIISGERLAKPNNGRMRVHKIENVNKSLAFLHTKVIRNCQEHGLFLSLFSFSLSSIPFFRDLSSVYVCVRARFFRLSCLYSRKPLENEGSTCGTAHPRAISFVYRRINKISQEKVFEHRPSAG